MTMLTITFCAVVGLIKVACAVRWSDGLTIPNLPDKHYVRNGDLVLGGLFPVHKFSATKPCSDKLYDNNKMQMVESMVYAINNINIRHDLLPNISLGWAIMDTCARDSTALVRALSFVPAEQVHTAANMNDSHNSIPRFKVVGVVGAIYSSPSMAAAQILNTVKVPMVSPMSTSELLSDKVRFGYFLRVVQPDVYQAQAIVDLLRHFNWTYVSVLHSEGSYGFQGGKRIHTLGAQYGICVAYDQEIGDAADEKAFDNIVSKLVKNRNARAVVIFGFRSTVKGVLRAAKKLNATGFIWIMTDAIANSHLKGFDAVSIGSLITDIYMVQVPTFSKYFESLNPLNTANPWFPELWEHQFKCLPAELVTTNATTTCKKTHKMTDFPDYIPLYSSSLIIDAVETFAYALHNMISDDCPEMFADPSTIRNCINGERLLDFLKNVTFHGTRGIIKFDEAGDLKDRYTYRQYRGNGQTEFVGLWDRATKTIALNHSLLQWVNINGVNTQELQSSICSLPCKPDEFYVQLELKCCWDCRRCRSNEIVYGNASSCRACPPYQWPDATFGFCEDIEPTHFSWGEPMGILCTCLAVLGVLCSVTYNVLFIIHRNNRLIKASSRQLSQVMLIGILIAYVTVFFLVMKPAREVCYINRLGFMLSGTLVYAPLLTKTNCIYRIFSAGRSGVKRLPPVVGPKSQITVSSLLILIQLIIVAVTLILIPPIPMLNMPIPTEKHVELLCSLPISALIPPLAYNGLLVLGNAYYGYKTRKLPDNFNESKFIFLSVCASLFLWIAFYPTYFTAFHAVHKAILLCCALIMNATVMLLCFFWPKVYAVYCVDEESQRLNTTFVASVGVTPVTHMPNMAASLSNRTISTCT